RARGGEQDRERHAHEGRDPSSSPHTEQRVLPGDLGTAYGSQICWRSGDSIRISGLLEIWGTACGSQVCWRSGDSIRISGLSHHVPRAEIRILSPDLVCPQISSLIFGSRYTLVVRVWGLTGNIGSGKSTVARLLAARGVP